MERTLSNQGLKTKMTHKNQTEKKEPRAVILKLFSLRIKRGSTDDKNVDKKLDFI